MTRLHVPASTSLGSPLTGTVRSQARHRVAHAPETAPAARTAPELPWHATRTPGPDELSLLDWISLAG